MTANPGPATTSTWELTLTDGERWWGGSVDDAVHSPMGTAPFQRDLSIAQVSESGRPDRPSGQSAPLLISTTGRVVFSERPFAFAFHDNRLTVTGVDVQSVTAGDSLRDAYLAASQRSFPPSGATPARAMFEAPQYNTWIEHPFKPTQQSVLRYAQGLLEAGLPPGPLFIDDCWAEDYGEWRFDTARFPDPKAMVDQLHAWGFHVLLWLVPFVSPDSLAFRHLEKEGLLIRDADGETAIRRWWNGFSALLDVSHPGAIRWLTDQLDALVDDVGIDGFKFDAGDIRDYRVDDITHSPVEPVDQCENWARVGLRYPFNEYRACWRMGGQALAQRLQDKPPSWGPEGIGSLIPEMLVQAMIGHPYVCPDMIGGGEIGSVSGQGTIDQEFVVRYAQLAAMSPMMQFSIAPQRVLDAVHLDAVKQALAVRAELLPTILELVDEASRTGEPVLRPMAYHSLSAAQVTDQFFLGPDLFVAPVLSKGAVERSVVIPEGKWKDDNGSEYQGPATATVPVSLTSMPRFRRLT